MQVLTVPSNSFGDFKYEIVCLHKFCYRQVFFFILKIPRFSPLFKMEKKTKKEAAIAAADLGLTV